VLVDRQEIGKIMICYPRAVAMPKSSITIKEFADILVDLDAYIAKGGRLLDVVRVPWQELPPEAVLFISHEVGPEILDRFAKFLKRAHKVTGGAGRDYTEEELQTAWRETAGPSSESLH
jgi:hypothetical protein